MEKMQISLISLVQRNGIVVARARVEAEQARIWVEVWFPRPPGATNAALWDEAYDRVLTVLDPA